MLGSIYACFAYAAFVEVSKPYRYARKALFGKSLTGVDTCFKTL